MVEFELPLRRLALAVLEDKSGAERVVRQALALALVERYDFKLGEHVRAWFFRKAIRVLRKEEIRLTRRRKFTLQPPLTEAWRTLQESTWYVRIGGLLQGLLGWSTTEAIEATGIPAIEGARQIELERGVRNWMEQHDPTPYWEQAFWGQWPEGREELVEEQKNALRMGILSEQQRQFNRQRWRNRWNELAWLAPIILLTWVFILYMKPPTENRKITGQDTNALVETAYLLMRDNPSATVTPASVELRQTYIYLSPIRQSLASIADKLGLQQNAIWTEQGNQPAEDIEAGTRLVLQFDAPPWKGRKPATGGVFYGIPSIGDYGLAADAAGVYPLTAHSTPAQVSLALQESRTRWKSLRLMIEQSLYGVFLSQAMGHPDIQLQHEVWVHQEKGYLARSGLSESFERELRLALGNLTFWFLPGRSEIRVLPADSVSAGVWGLTDPVASDWFTWLEEGQVEGVEQVAGRVALAVALQGHAPETPALNLFGSTLTIQLYQPGEPIWALVWLDVQRGLVLRVVYYGDATRQSPRMELRVTKIAYDIYLPDELFDPEKAGETFSAFDF